MSRRSATGREQLQSDSATSRSPDEGCKSTKNAASRHEPRMSLSDRDSEETSAQEVQQQDGPSFLDSGTPRDENEGMVITNIRATDVSLGLRRIPASFYTIVQHSGLKWRTEDKSCSVDPDIVEWTGPIPIPSDVSATISLEVYASFEFQPMLGTGEQLRRLTITVKQLLDCSATDVSFTLSPIDGDVISPCSSILLTAKRRECKNGDSSMLRVLGPLSSTTEPESEVEDATNQGHGALSRYRKHGDEQDLRYSLEAFERALDICPSSHPCYAAAQSNLAAVNFIACQVENTDPVLSLGLYCDVLGARPVGHPDRLSTSIQLAAVHFARLEKSRDKVDGAHVEALLNEVMELSSAESHANRAARFMLRLFAAHIVDPAQLDNIPAVEQGSSSGLGDDVLLSLSFQLLQRFEQSGFLADLQQAITGLKEFIRSPSPSPRYYAALENLGIALSHRFRCLGQLGDLEEAISTLADAVDLIPHGHPNESSCLNSLGIAFSTRFEHFRQLSDLEEAISMYSIASDLIPHGHSDKPCCLNNLGKSFEARFICQGHLSDLEDAVSTLRNAVDLTPHGHPNKSCHLDSLGNAFFTRFQHLGQLTDLEDAVSRQRDAVSLTPHNHSHKPPHLNNLGASLIARFTHLGQSSDIEEAISTLKNAVNLTPHSHPDKFRFLCNLGNAFSARFERHGQLSDLEETISTFKNADDLVPRGHPDKLKFLSNLSDSLIVRFKHLDQPSDIEDAISTLRNAVDLTPHGHVDKPHFLCNLGNSLFARFQRLGQLSDLEDAISGQRNAVDLTPHYHLHRPGYLNNLGNSLLSRFLCVGQLADLEDAVSTLKDAVDLTPDGHPDKPRRLNNLVNSFITRFQRLGELSDLEDAISRQRDAVELTPNDNPDKPSYLTTLGNSLFTCFERLGQLDDLEAAISTLMDAVDHTHHDHPNKPNCLNNLGNAFLARFERLGQLRDLEDAVSRQRDAVALTPHSHPDKPRYLSNLGNSHKARFERLGELSDIEDAISSLRGAVDLTPRGHPDKPRCLCNLGNSFRARFERLGQLSDLEDAISTLRNAVDLTPHGHPDKFRLLTNLSNSFFTRFECLGQPSDLEDAISTQRTAINLTPHGHPKKRRCLHSLGNTFLACFKRTGQLSDLEYSISMFGDAVDLTPHDHPDKPRYLSSLGLSLVTRFERLGQLSDLKDAISSQSNAVDLIPTGHADKPCCLNNLAISFLTCFESLGHLSDLENAVSRLRDAVNLAPHGHPDMPGYLNNLGDSFLTRFERLSQLSDLENAISSYLHAASAPFGPVAVRFRASQYWISCARYIGHHSLLHAYSVAINLLPQLAWIGFSLSYRYTELARGANVVQGAAAAALELGFPETAAEWLEQGRSIVWGELFRLRSSSEELSSAYPDHARRLRELSTALDHASATHERHLSALSEENQRPRSLEEEAHRHRMLAIERDKLLQQIRRLPGFERFLLQKEFSQLRASTHAGPVVILNAAECRCDALIIAPNVDHVIHVPLPNFPFRGFPRLQHILKDLLRDPRVIRFDEREGGPDPEFQKTDEAGWESLLSPLWICVVKPVLDALAFSTPGNPSRIFWCPTGSFTFLPIHAAGLYDARCSQPGHKVFDFVISSYAPTLSILAPSSNSDTDGSGHLRLLTVRQPPSDGLTPLPGVATELKYITTVIRNSPSACTTLLESSVGAVEDVLELMKEADWVHFACHGTQDTTNPIDSGLCLADARRLKISDIIALSRSRGGLAFLSACQTATGDERLSDEAVHIAAGMLFAGYAGVIGTMWSISDSLAPAVARDVYEQLFLDRKRPDYREAARALHEAIGCARESGASFVEWVPFIHLGL